MFFLLMVTEKSMSGKTSNGKYNFIIKKALVVLFAKATPTSPSQNNVVKIQKYFSLSSATTSSFLKLNSHDITNKTMGIVLKFFPKGSVTTTKTALMKMNGGFDMEVENNFITYL
jgi:hypothetical protein